MGARARRAASDRPGKPPSSATRLYGADMERRWGRGAAGARRAPARAERWRARGRLPRGLHTRPRFPPRLLHLHEPEAARACHKFTGDVTGVRIEGACMLAPTPPPDIDLQARARIARVGRELARESLRRSRISAHTPTSRSTCWRCVKAPASLRKLAGTEGEEAFAAAIRARISASTGRRHRSRVRAGQRLPRGATSPASPAILSAQESGVRK